MNRRSSKKEKIDETVRGYYVEKWKTAMEMWDKEADRFWARNNIFLLLAGALTVLLTAASLSSAIRSLVSVLGVLFTYIWMRVNQRGKFYLDRWKPIIEDLEEKTGIPVLRRLSHTRKRASTKYMEYGTIIFMVIYSLVLLASILELLQSLNFHAIN